MNARIVADGERRWRESPEHRARLAALRQAIRRRHAAALAEAGLLRRVLRRWRMTAAYRRERRRIEPSPEALYGTRSM